MRPGTTWLVTAGSPGLWGRCYEWLQCTEPQKLLSVNALKWLLFVFFLHLVWSASRRLQSNACVSSPQPPSSLSPRPSWLKTRSERATRCSCASLRYWVTAWGAEEVSATSCGSRPKRLEKQGGNGKGKMTQRGREAWRKEEVLKKNLPGN